ncbi:MAG: hypothetical protein C0606_00315 [Hyphomicrobiales bacterium]|nr:MAG: hypothetical protein C0606_00315 [Hyphomicrobiales bacterium]
MVASALLAATGFAAEAQTVKPRPAPGDCEKMALQHGAETLWWGRFSGRKIGFFDRTENRSEWACFLTERECNDWLYWMRTDYPERWWINRCDKGYGG